MFGEIRTRMTKGGREVNGDWLGEEFSRLSLSGAIVGKRLGCDPTKIYNHLKNRNTLNADLLAALWVAYPDLDMRFILTGEHSNTPSVFINKQGNVNIEIR